MMLSFDPMNLAGDPEGGLFIGDAGGAERRKGLRIRQHRPIKAYVPTACRFIGGQTEDVSSSGLRVTMPHTSMIRSGDLLNIHVGLSEGGQPLANRRDMMLARVVWVDEPADASSRTLSAGLEWTSSIAAHLDAA
ncbi:MAG: PilZ domain-containing protein [Tepidisphaeraceae bacterium]|jgi:hypothetical protein